MRSVWGFPGLPCSMASCARSLPREEWNMGSICIESLEKEQERHVREMKRARNFIRGKRGKTEFELCVMDSFDSFL